VLDHQPSLFGIGRYKLSSTNTVNALVNHGHFQVQNNFVRFIRADDAEQNHKASQGFRRGWLMMLGIHPDYRNDLDIANAVSTFGKFHSWNREDPIKERVLVYASFPSLLWCHVMWFLGNLQQWEGLKSIGLHVCSF
jgi:hypothetical protein